MKRLVKLVTLFFCAFMGCKITPLKAMSAKEIVDGWQKCTVLRGHTESVESIAFHPQDPRVLASCSHDRTIRLWNSAEPEKEPLILRGHTDWVNSVAFHPQDPKMLASCSDDNTIRLWNSADPEQEPLILRGHTDWVNSVAFHPQDPRMLASCSYDNTIRLWNSAEPGKKPLILRGHTESVRSIAFHPQDQRMLASGSTDKTIRVWDSAEPEQEPLILRGHTDWVNSVAFHPQDPTILASGSTDKTIRLWDISDLSAWTEESSSLKKYFQDTGISPDKIAQRNQERWLLIGLDHLRKQYPDDADYKKALKAQMSKNHIQKTLAGLPKEVQAAFIAKYCLDVLRH